MVIMEYLEGGSLADNLNIRNKPLSNFSAPIHRSDSGRSRVSSPEKKYYSDIKPANILLTSENNTRCIKICYFEIAVGTEWSTESSVTSSHIKEDFQYMSPERLNNASRSAANDT